MGITEATGSSFAVAMLAASQSNAALTTFVLYTLGVFVIAALSNRLLRGKSFLSEYFLGSRSLGAWAFALTFAATSASGGTFTGFPAKIYTHGWCMALWIASYMVYPICTMGFLGKRINQVARKSGAITVPDVLRDRYDSRLLGILSTLLILFFLAFNLVAQFKAGSVILQTLLQDAPLFETGLLWLSATLGGGTAAGGGYVACLLLFGVAVILYTTYGGFHAVVWTDVMQGVVMVAGVLILLPLALWQTGGLDNATRRLQAMQPPRYWTATLTLAAPTPRPLRLSEVWLGVEDETGRRLFRVAGVAAFAKDQQAAAVRLVEILTPEEIEAHWPRLSDPGSDLNRGLSAALSSIPQPELEPGASHATAAGRALDGAAVRWPFGAGATGSSAPQLTATLLESQDFAHGAGEAGHYVTLPGPVPPLASQSDSSANLGFLPWAMGISFFFMWAISGTGQPQYMVRLMAFKDSRTLRRGIIAVTLYYGAIYFPLVIVFCCARVLLPGLDQEADRIMPTLAVTLTERAGHRWLAGLLIAAPFAAVMSTVDSYLLVISSSVVRDLYQRNLNPDASERTIKRISYLTTLLVGGTALYFAIDPPRFLQDIIVYVGSGLAACFLFPVVAALYWPRSNQWGCLASLLAGFGVHLLMHLIGKWMTGEFTRPYDLFGFSPVIVGLAASLAALLIVTPLTPRPDERIVWKYFFREG